MKSILLVLLVTSICFAHAQQPAEQYPVDSASVEHAGVPKGEILKFTFNHSAIFPGTSREVSVYVPAQYRSGDAACVYVNQDGIQWKAPTVFDNLINAHEMPVTIAVFVTPGKIVAGNTSSAQDRFNRSFEYDGLGNSYAKMMVTEIFPEVEKLKTSDGRTIRLSRNGNDRAIGGSSSGAVCAFTAAWEMPKEFSRVFSAIGTYVSLRGADRYPGLIRKYEPKPIRIFLQDGSNDLNIYGGDWWKANESMERALVFAGYEVNHEWGQGGHSGSQGTSLFPAAMRWLWKDWPKPVSAGMSKNQVLNDLLVAGTDWELVGQGYGFTEGTAANSKGEVFFQDIPNAKTYKVGVDNKLVALPLDSKKASGSCFATDGSLYTTAGATNQILRYGPDGKITTVADSIKGNDLVVAANGNVYVTSPDGPLNPSKLYLIGPAGERKIVDQGIKFANGVALSPDQSQLYVTESASHWIWIYSVQPDGSLSNKQKYGWLHVPDSSENAWSDGLKCDTAGRVFVASRLGIQILDQLGRVNAILPLPPSSYPASNCCFGGPDFNILYVSCGDRVFRRRLKTRGVNPFEIPHRPANPHL